MGKEYLGYIPESSSGINEWSSLSGQVSSVLKDAIGTRARERAAFDQERMSNEEKINSYEIGKSQTLNTLVLDGANSIRSLMYDWNKAANEGKMTRSEYMKRQSNVRDYWSSLANSAKVFDQRVEETLKRQQAGEDGFIPGSSLELYINKKHSEIANLKNKSIYTNPENGVIYLAEYDDDGNIVNQVDVRQMNNPGNTLDDRINLDLSIENGTKGWSEWKTFTEGAMGSSTTISDLRQNPSFISAKNSLISSILSNPRSIASVLADNSDGNYSYYTSYEEKVQFISEEMIKAKAVADEAGVEFLADKFIEDQESKMILLERDETGVYQPYLTKDQIDAAKKTVSDRIEVQIGYEKEGTVKRAPVYYGGGGGSGSGDGSADGSDYALYEEITKAWALGSQDFKKSGFLLNNASGGKYRFSWENGGITVRSGSPVEDGSGQKSYPVIAKGITNLRNLAPYFYGTGTGTKGTRDSFLEYDQQKAAYQSANPKKTSKNSTPKKGDEVDGYIFLGGDPSSQNNWKKK